jgi:hypothetical protein
MEKETVRITVFKESVTYEDYKIDDFLKIIADAKEKGATDVEFDSETEWESSSCKMSIYFEREETDDEFNIRVQKEKRNDERQRAYDIREYETLKKKLGIK